MNFKKLFVTMALLAIVVGVAQSATKVYYLVGVYNVYKCDYPDPFEQERQQIEEDYSDAITNAQTRYEARVNNIKDLELPYDEEDALIAKAKAKLDLATDQAAMDREDALSEYYEVDFTIRDNHPEFVIEDGLACQIVCVEYNASRVFLYFTFFEPWYGYIGRTPYGWGYRQRYHYDDYRVKYRDFRNRGSIRYREPRVWRDRWNERRPERRNEFKPVRRIERQRQDPKGWRTNSINRRTNDRVRDQRNDDTNRRPDVNNRPKSGGREDRTNSRDQRNSNDRIRPNTRDDRSSNDRLNRNDERKGSSDSGDSRVRSTRTGTRSNTPDKQPEDGRINRSNREDKSSDTRERPRVRTRPDEQTKPNDSVKSNDTGRRTGSFGGSRRANTPEVNQPTRPERSNDKPNETRERPRRVEPVKPDRTRTDDSNNENRSRNRDSVNNDRPQRPSRDSKPEEPKREERKRVEPVKPDRTRTDDSNNENRSRNRDSVNNDRPQRPSRDSKPVEPKREERKRVEPSKDTNKPSDSNKSDKSKDENKGRRRRN